MPSLLSAPESCCSIVAASPTKDRHNLGQARAPLADAASTEAYVANFVCRDRHGPKIRFETGDDVWLDIDVKANQRCKELSLSLFIRDDKLQHFRHLDRAAWLAGVFETVFSHSSAHRSRTTSRRSSGNSAPTWS